MNSIPIAIINLERSPERLKNITKQLNQLCLDYFIIDAIDGKKLSTNNLPKNIYDSQRAFKCIKRDLTINEIACVMSHIKAWNFLKKSSYNEILVLEDDALFGTRLRTIINNVGSFPSDWDLINLYSGQGEYELLSQSIENLKLKVFTNKMNGAVGYIINRSCVKKCLHQVYPIRMASDGMLAGLTSAKIIKSYGTIPQVITINDELFPSTIGKR